MKMKRIVLKGFGRIVAVLDGGASKHQATRMVNFTVAGKKLKFRAGYVVAATPPVGAATFRALGLGYVQNREGGKEFVGVERRNGVVRAVRYHAETLARDFVGTSELEDREWVVASYGDSAYLIDPGGTQTVFRHVIGDDASLVPIQDSSYSGPPADPNVSITYSPLGTVPFDTAADTITITAQNTITVPSVASSGTGFTVSGKADDNGPQNPMGVTVEVLFADTKNFTGSDAFAIVLDKGPQFDDLKNDLYTPQLRIAGSWVNVVGFHEYRPTDGAATTLICHIKGMSISSVQGIRFRATTTHVAYRDATVRVAFTVRALFLGGVYLEATADTKRLWDAAAGKDGVTYGVRFRDAAGDHLSAVYSATISREAALGFFPSGYSCGLGGRIYVGSSIAPEAPYDRAEILRLTDDGSAWKVLSTVSGSPFTAYDSKCEYELSGLGTAAGTSGGSVNVEPPVFRTKGIVGAFPFKQFMVWLVSGGEANLQLSRVGNAEELYDPQKTYDEADNTQPGQRTLADNEDDEPVWGTQMGDIALVVGHRRAYVMSGDYPRLMTPSRAIAGSRGIVGRYAGVRFRSIGGAYSAAYADGDLNIWLVESTPAFQGDGRGQPLELSLAVRGLLWEFLYIEQLSEAPDLELKNLHLEFDESTSSLWCLLGSRAAIYRQDMNESGWELSKFTVVSGGWDRFCFTESGKHLAIRRSGGIDLIERDFRTGELVVGTDRDGGEAPPGAEWISQDFSFEGGQGRICNAQLHTTMPSDMPTCWVSVGGGGWVAGFRTGPAAGGRWVRFPLRSFGLRSRVRVTMPESMGGIEGLGFELLGMSSGKV